MSDALRGLFKDDPAGPVLVDAERERRARDEKTLAAAVTSEDSPFSHIRESEKRHWLEAMALTGRAGAAESLTGISRTMVYRKSWAEDDQFQGALVTARKMGMDAVKEEAFRRAIEGVLEPTGFFKGQPGAYVRKYSDSLLEKILPAYFEEFRAKVDITHEILRRIDVTRLSNEMVNRLLTEDPVRVLTEVADAYGALRKASMQVATSRRALPPGATPLPDLPADPEPEPE